MSKTILILLFVICADNLPAQNHTAVTRRNYNENQLEQYQINVFAKLLDNMVFVDGGTFYMGNELEEGEMDQDANRHRVTIDPFFISRYEVTQELWTTVLDYNPAQFKDPQNPIENVSWEEVQQFIQKLNNITGMNFRLPTEAEWEFAAKGGTFSLGYRFAGSDFPKAVAWVDENSKFTTHNVAMKRPNELGIYDMSGNVAEWCQDFYQHDYYIISPEHNPKGPQVGNNHVNRGGSWVMDQKYAKTYSRNLASPKMKSQAIGFRLAM